MLNFSASPQSKGISDFLGWCEKVEKAMEPYRKAEKAMEPFLLEWRKAENVLSRIGIFALTPNPKQRSAAEVPLPVPAATQKQSSVTSQETLPENILRRPKRVGRPRGGTMLKAVVNALKESSSIPVDRERMRQEVEEKLGFKISLTTLDRARRKCK